VNGKRLVVLVGQKRALAMAIKGRQTQRRWVEARRMVISLILQFARLLASLHFGVV
jgi:hypothetical protein